MIFMWCQEIYVLPFVLESVSAELFAKICDVNPLTVSFFIADYNFVIDSFSHTRIHFSVKLYHRVLQLAMSPHFWLVLPSQFILITVTVTMITFHLQE